MVNTGTWNSNIAMLYFAIFMLPFFLLLVKWIFEAMPDTTIVHVDKIIEKEKIVEVPVYKTKTVEKIVYRDRVVKQNKSTPEKKPIANPATSTSTKNDVISGLFGLGIKKSDAKNLVKSLCNNKTYSNADTLMRDCLTRL
jgi:Holliday junction resolvasome RuvABC DNA-binding subunit